MPFVVLFFTFLFLHACFNALKFCFYLTSLEYLKFSVKKFTNALPIVALRWKAFDDLPALKGRKKLPAHRVRCQWITTPIKLKRRKHSTNFDNRIMIKTSGRLQSSEELINKILIWLQMRVVPSFFLLPSLPSCFPSFFCTYLLPNFFSLLSPPPPRALLCFFLLRDNVLSVSFGKISRVYLSVSCFPYLELWTVALMTFVFFGRTKFSSRWECLLSTHGEVSPLPGLKFLFIYSRLFI